MSLKSRRRWKRLIWMIRTDGGTLSLLGIALFGLALVAAAELAGRLNGW